MLRVDPLNDHAAAQIAPQGDTLGRTRAVAGSIEGGDLAYVMSPPVRPVFSSDPCARFVVVPMLEGTECRILSTSREARPRDRRECRALSADGRSGLPRRGPRSSTAAAPAGACLPCC